MSVTTSSGVAQRPRSRPRIPVVFFGVLLIASCVRQLPPAATPDPRAPAIDAGAPIEAGRGRLIIDVVDGPTQVHRVHMEARPLYESEGRPGFRFVETAELLCPTSPCIADLPASNVILSFPVIGDSGASEVELVHIDLEPTVYRRSLSRYDGRGRTGRILGIIATSLGGASLSTGATLLPIGLKRGNDSLTLAGASTLGVGAIALTLGIVAIWAYSPTYQAGSAVHFSLQPPN